MQWAVRWKYQKFTEGLAVVEADTAEEAIIAVLKLGRKSAEYLTLGARFTVYRVGAWT